MLKSLIVFILSSCVYGLCKFLKRKISRQQVRKKFNNMFFRLLEDRIYFRIFIICRENVIYWFPF